MSHRAFAHWRPAAALLVLGALLLTLTGASGLWSDSGTVTGNVVQAGTISLDLRGAINKPIHQVVSGDPIHGEGGLLPGQSSDPGEIQLYNDGTQAQKQYMHIENKVGALCDWVTLTVARDWVAGAPITFDEPIGTSTLAALEGQGNRISVGRTFDQGPGVVPDNFTTILVQKANLDAATPNSFNGTGATCEWDEVFTAEQVGP